MPPHNTQCPVLGCGKWSHRWKHSGHIIPAADVFTLQLDPQLATPSNIMICHACWKRHTDPSMSLDGRTRVVPSLSSSSSPSLSSSSLVDGAMTLLIAAHYLDGTLQAARNAQAEHHLVTLPG